MTIHIEGKAFKWKNKQGIITYTDLWLKGCTLHWHPWRLLPPLKNSHLVFTGELGRMSRKNAEQLAVNLGATVHGAIARSLDFVIVGNKPGSKFAKANKANIPILTEEEFFYLVKPEWTFYNKICVKGNRGDVVTYHTSQFTNPYTGIYTPFDTSIVEVPNCKGTTITVKDFPSTIS